MEQTTSIKIIKNTFADSSIQQKFTELLGEQANGFILSVINVVSGNKDLAKAEPQSVVFAAATAAILKLPINPNLGFAYILPYLNRKTGAYEAQFQMGYKGYIQLAQRSGQFKTLSATPIYEGQIIAANPLTGYEFDFTTRESNNVVGYAAYFALLNGFEKILYMSKEEVDRHAKRYSKNFQKYGSGLWKDDFDSMALKTVIKQLLQKFAPLSIDMQKAVERDQAVLRDFDGIELEYPDNSRPDAEEVSKQKEISRVEAHIKASNTEEVLSEAGDFIDALEPTHPLVTLYKTKLEELTLEAA